MITAENFYQNNFQKASKIVVSQATMDKVKGMVAGKKFEQVVKMALESSPKMQFVALASMYCIAVENSQNPADFDPADGIIWRLGESIAKYGEKAYPLSEAQIRLAVAKLRPWIK